MKQAEDKLQIMVKNPTTLFMYWRWAEYTKRMAVSHVRKPWDTITQAIRLYACPNRLDDDDVVCVHPAQVKQGFKEGEASSCYLQGLQPDYTYMLELGIYSPWDDFIPLQRSEPVETPRWNIVQTEGVLPTGRTSRAEAKARRLWHAVSHPPMDWGWTQISTYTLYQATNGQAGPKGVERL